MLALPAATGDVMICRKTHSGHTSIFTALYISLWARRRHEQKNRTNKRATTVSGKFARSKKNHQQQRQQQ